MVTENVWQPSARWVALSQRPRPRRIFEKTLSSDAPALARLPDRQGDSDGRSFSFLRIDLDLTTKTPHDAASDREPEASALALRFGRKECIKDFRQIGAGDAATAIVNLDRDVPIVGLCS